MNLKEVCSGRRHATHQVVTLFFDDISPLCAFCGVFCVGGSVVKGKGTGAWYRENALLKHYISPVAQVWLISLKTPLSAALNAGYPILKQL